MIMLIVLATLRDKLVRKAVKWTWIMFGDFSINDVLINGLKKYSNIMLTFNKPLCDCITLFFNLLFFKLVSLIVVRLAALSCHC